ncbi:MAG: hypothetical protein KDB07_06505, partial [Planctomycetes bacterium]|nr:hypothetical protein [Planctomycetota bacterium]
RRCFEMAQTYRIARVTNFSFQSTEVDFFRERVPSAIHLSSAREESVEAIGGATDMGGYLIEAPEDPFRIVYQPLSMTFYADQVEALNFLAEMARESESSTQRAIFPISWSITREPGARPGTGQYKVVLSAVAIREVQGANLGLDAISILMPNATGGFFPGG